MAENERDVAGELAEATLNGSIDLANQAMDYVLARQNMSFWDRIREFFNPAILSERRMAETIARQKKEESQRAHNPRNRFDERHLEGEPEVIANFMRNFQAQNENEQSRFDYLVKQLDSGKSLKSHYFILADIGYGDVLNHLYENSPKSYEVRSRVMENRHCPEHLLYEGLKDDHPLVRKAAVENPNLSQSHVMALAYREQDPAVQDALRKRLGDSHPEKMFQYGSPVLRPYDSPSIGQTPLTKAYEDQRQKLQEVRKKLPLNDQIKAAQQKHEAQLAGVGKVRAPIAPER